MIAKVEKEKTHSMKQPTGQGFIELKNIDLYKQSSRMNKNQ